MLNKYGNAVDFSGEQRNVLEVLAWFKELIFEKGANLSMGEEAFNNISFLGDGRVWFESTGEAGMEMLQEIAEEFKVDFVHYFGNNLSYGEAVYNQGKLTLTVLDEEDLGSISYDWHGMSYLVGEMPFTDQKGAMNHLLEQKKQQKQDRQNNNDGHPRLKR